MTSPPREPTWNGMRPGTASVWAGEMQPSFGRATQTPIVNSVSYAYETVDEWLAVARGEAPGHIYGRNSNPTVQVFEEKIRALEGAEAATCFASGMAAISNTLYALLSAGDRVVSVNHTYGGTSKLFLEFLPRCDISATLCDTADHGQIEAEVAKGCHILYLETPTNPTLHVLDLERLVAAAHSAGAIAVVDNTLATPVNQRPLDVGADLVVHSATKYLGGHSDALGGALCGRSDLVERVFRFREINGASLHPTAASMLVRGMKTLELRIRRHNENAMRVAAYLEQRPEVKAVYYPGLESNPGHEIARRQMLGYGGVLAFSLHTGFDGVKSVLGRLRLAHLAAHLGAVGTVAGPPSTTSHVETTPAQRAELGIPEGLIRYSTGIENHEDLIDDLASALKAM